MIIKGDLPSTPIKKVIPIDVKDCVKLTSMLAVPPPADPETFVLISEDSKVVLSPKKFITNPPTDAVMMLKFIIPNSVIKLLMGRVKKSILLKIVV